MGEWRNSPSGGQKAQWKIRIKRIYPAFVINPIRMFYFHQFMEIVGVNLPILQFKQVHNVNPVYYYLFPTITNKI